MPDGRWVSIPAYTGRYTPELGTVYSRCLARALAGLKPREPAKPTSLQEFLRKARSGSRLAGRERSRASGSERGGSTLGSAVAVGSPSMPRHEVRMLVGSTSVPVDGDGKEEAVKTYAEDETPAERRRREEELERDASAAEELWRKRADEKDWTQVKVDLEVYRFSGQKVTDDPRRSDE